MFDYETRTFIYTFHNFTLVKYEADETNDKKTISLNNAVRLITTYFSPTRLIISHYFTNTLNIRVPKLTGNPALYCELLGKETIKFNNNSAK